ncbi:MAG TPA: hypothetical protein VH475_24450 [Tepidisphaeraceae bacterium]|jgi:hypothetical protein
MSATAPHRLILLCLILTAPALLADGPADPQKNIFNFGQGGKGTVNPPAATQPAAPPKKDVPVVATAIQIVADDFVAEIYHNGKPVPTESRKLQDEVYGAQVERVTLDLRPGDWVVFNVVNNRLRWGGAYYFAAAVLAPDGTTAFPSETRTGDWSACDDLNQAAKFVSDRDHLRDHKPQPIAKKWDRGDQSILKRCPDFNGEGIWGDPASKSTWIKFVVPSDPGGARGL